MTESIRARSRLWRQLRDDRNGEALRFVRRCPSLLIPSLALRRMGVCAWVRTEIYVRLKKLRYQKLRYLFCATYFELIWVECGKILGTKDLCVKYCDKRI